MDASLAPEGSRDLALFQEVLHHGIELGGRNEWTGGVVRRAAVDSQITATKSCSAR